MARLMDRGLNAKGVHLQKHKCQQILVKEFERE
jgi:hypothetical protein